MASRYDEKLTRALEDAEAFAGEHGGQMETRGPLDDLRDAAMRVGESVGLIEALADLDAQHRIPNRTDADLNVVVALGRTAFVMGVIAGWKAAQ